MLPLTVGGHQEALLLVRYRGIPRKLHLLLGVGESQTYTFSFTRDVAISMLTRTNGFATNALEIKTQMESYSQSGGCSCEVSRRRSRNGHDKVELEMKAFTTKWFVSQHEPNYFLETIDPPKLHIAPDNGWLEDKPLLLGR